MRAITILGVIIIAGGILFYIAQQSVSTHVVPSLQEYIASTTTQDIKSQDNQASVAWLASSTIVDSLLPTNSTSSSQKTIQENKKVTAITQSTSKTDPTSAKITPTASDTQKNSSLIPLKTPKGTIYVTVAKNPTTRERGLSGYTSLDADEGMLFIFPTPGEPSFWMKDMNFPIDMVWIRSDRKIIGVTSNISPETFPKTFSPPGKIQFVLEVNAGSAEKFGLAVGTTVVF